MREQTIDILARLAAGLPADAISSSRAAPLVASSKKGKKGSRKKKGSQNQKALQQCEQQVGTCQTLVTAQCGEDAACLAAQVPCCTLLNTCDFTAFLGCLAG